MMQAVRKWMHEKRPSRASIGRVLAILVSSGALLALEGFFFHDYLGVADEKLSILPRAYQAILTAGYRSTIPRTCTVVTLAPRFGEPVCSTRRRLNNAITLLLKHQPGAIVAAVTLQDGITCTKGETDELVGSIQSACLSGTPMVLGHDFEYHGPQPYRMSGLTIVPTGRVSKCGMGHTSPERDFRLVPLEIEVQGQPYPSLAWRAAQLVNRDLLTHPVISAVREKREKLYTSLLSEKDFETNSLAEQELFADSSSGSRLDRVRNRVVVIGFEGEVPVATNVGFLAPHFLHAAYIEAYLDGRVLQGVPAWVYWLVAIAFWSAVEFIQWRRGLWFALAAILAGLLLLLTATIILVHFGGRYTDFPTISLAGLFVWTTHLIARLGVKH